jgi:hypothetical protein
MARKSRRSKRTIVGAAKSSAASVQRIAVRAATAECRRPSRRRIGREVNARPDDRGEKAVWKKQNEDGDRAKEKTLDRRGC